MILYRVFDWDGRAKGREPNGPFFSPRHLQGPGRHDIPSRDGVLYASLSAVSAIAESIQTFKGQTLVDEDFVRSDGRRRALAVFSLSDRISLLDLRDPKVLAARHISPAHITTREYAVTRQLAMNLFDENVAGFLWISALMASWTNASLFDSRVAAFLKLEEPPKPLTVGIPALRDAAKAMSVELD